MTNERNGEKPSDWQAKIEGDWHGIPSMFDAEGNQVGHIKVSRASTLANGRLTYTMDTAVDVRGPLRARFEARDFAFGVADQGHDRVYMGPDFFGAGQPWGSVVDAHYYSPAWAADLRTMVHVLPDGKTQAYSSLLYEGPAIVAVFNGIYKVSHDYAKNGETRAFIDSFLEREKAAGGRPHVLPFKHAGQWRGELATMDEKHNVLEPSRVRIDYRPISLTRASVDLQIQGPFEKRLRFERSRVSNRHVYEGPDVWGNAMGYGRALYTTQHVRGQALSLQGREFLIDDDYSLSVVWQVWSSGARKQILYGLLAWEPGEEVLPARY